MNTSIRPAALLAVFSLLIGLAACAPAARPTVKAPATPTAAVKSPTAAAKPTTAPAAKPHNRVKADGRSDRRAQADGRAHPGDDAGAARRRPDGGRPDDHADA